MRQKNKIHKHDINRTRYSDWYTWNIFSETKPFKNLGFNHCQTFFEFQKDFIKVQIDWNTDKIKVSEFQNIIFTSSILPKSDRKDLTLLLCYLKSNCFRTFFGRIEDTKKAFRNHLTFIYLYIFGWLLKVW